MKKQGWQTRKLNDVCDFLNRGISPKYLETGGVCVLNQKCVRNHQIGYEPSRRHDLSAKKVGDGRFIQQGDVLVNSTGTGTLGRVAQVREHPTEPTTVDSHITIVRPKTAMFHLDFFGYMMIAIEDAIKEAGEGCGGQTELARSALAEKFPVTFPESLSEQRRIVAILDETLKGIDTAKVNAERNLQNARDIFESHLNASIMKGDSSYEFYQLNDVCEEITVGHVGSMATQYKEIGIPFLRSQNIRPFHISLENIVFIDEKFHRSLRKSTLRPGDVAVVRTGYPGTAAVIPESISECNCSDLVIVRPGKTIDAHYLALFFNSTHGKSLVAGKLVGAAQKHFNITAAKQVSISLPSMAEQRQIVAKLNSLHQETLRLESIYKRKLAALEDLKKSLLTHAFSGDL